MSEALDLIFGDDAELVPTQSPIQRPAPVQRPGLIERPGLEMPAPRPREAPRQPMPQAAPPPAAMPQVAPQPPTARGMSPRDAQDLIFGDDPAAAPMQPAAPPVQAGPFPGFKPIKDEGWGEYIVNNVRGRKDPRYAGVKALDQEMEAEGNTDFGRTMVRSAPFAVTDAGRLDVARNALGDRFVRSEKDAYGADVIVYRGPDGKERKAYENTPGLDSLDAGRFVAESLPYALAGGGAGVLAKGAGPLTKAITQGAAAASTSLAGDTAAILTGSEQQPDPSRAAVVGGLGAAAELAAPAVGAAWRKWVSEPSLFSGGKLTPKGEAAARAADLDPAILTQELAQQFAEETARTGSARQGKTVIGKQFNMPISRGQLDKDPGQLLTEKAMRTGNYGAEAKETMQSLDRRQANAVREGAIGGPDAKLSVAQQLAPDRVAEMTRPGDIGAGIASGVQEAQKAAKTGAREAWKGVGPIPATQEAIAELPAVLGPKLGNMRVDEKVTPAAASMLEDVRSFMKGDIPNQYADVIGKTAVPDVVKMRQRLFQVMRSAKPDNETDKATARAIYEGYSEWVETAAAKAVEAGDPGQILALRLATDKTREMKAIFAASGPRGSTQGRKLMQSMTAEGTTPENIVAGLFSGPGAAPKAGTMEALTLIKQASGKYLPPDRAKALWGDVKLGYWQKIVQKPDGSMHTPTMIAQNIDKAFQSQGTIVKMLLSPDDQKLIRQFGAAMKEIAYKDPNPSGSGVAAAFYAGQFGQAIIRMIMNPNGPMSRIISGLLGSTPVKNQIGNMAAQRAVAPRVRSQNPKLGTFGAIGGATATEDPDLSPLIGLFSGR